MSRSDKFGYLLCLLLAPLVLCWTGWSFWHLAMTGKLHLRDQGRFIEANSGFNFWLTLWLYGLLFVAALLVIGGFLRWLWAKRHRKQRAPEPGDPESGA